MGIKMPQEVSFLFKITNDIAVAVDQLGTRKGAIAVYIEPWHMDVSDFIDLRKNSGEERRRAHELFPALWINDLFMKRVRANDKWTLFDPADTQDLCDLYGEAFEKRYEEYEKDESIAKEIVEAKELWKKILLNYFETGLPFLCFKDNANKANPNAHVGIIRSSNLCTEIFSKIQSQIIIRSKLYLKMVMKNILMKKNALLSMEDMKNLLRKFQRLIVLMETRFIS